MRIRGASIETSDGIGQSRLHAPCRFVLCAALLSMAACAGTSPPMTATGDAAKADAARGDAAQGDAAKDPVRDAVRAPEQGGLIRDRVGLEFVRIPAGAFEMGNGEDPARMARDWPLLEASRFDALKDERPKHRVEITKAFWIGRHEVSVGAFKAFVQASGHRPQSVVDGTGGWGYRADISNRPGPSSATEPFVGRDPAFSWQSTGFPQDDRHPVVNVSWNDARAMARWLSEQEGVRYRLPTEAEWEYVCRAGTNTRFPWGDEPTAISRYANTFDQSALPYWRDRFPEWAAQAAPGSDGHAFTAPVGSYTPNAFGVYDMIGNVDEWTADWHGEEFYAESPTRDPTGASVSDVRVMRGGSWQSWSLYSRCSFRNWNDPDSRYPLTGFRLVREE